MSIRLRADLLLVLITLIWGSTFVVVKEALDQIGPMAFVAVRFWLATLALGAVALARRERFGGALWRDGLLTGLWLGAGYLFQTIALGISEASKVAFITGLYVALVPFLAAWLLRQRPSGAALAGVALALLGMALMTLDRSLRVAAGDLWTVACAVAFAVQIVAVSRFAARYPMWPFTVAQMLGAALLGTAGALLFEGGAAALLPAPALWPTLLFMGLVATAFVFLIQTWAQRHTTATHAALIFALEPVAAAAFAWLLVGERLSGREWLGGALILVGMLVTELWPLLRRERPVAGPLHP